jgi:hypothetical protein
MVITIIAEPRSGSTNLADYFKSNKDFTILQEPLNKYGKSYQKNNPINKWTYNTKHLLIKEIYDPNKNLKELIQFSDKIIILYRENKNEQLESWLVAKVTNNWRGKWVNSKIHIPNKELKIQFFNKMVNEFEIEYRLNNNMFKISYEELYYKNGFEKIVNYLNIDSVKNIDFPYGQKYRLDKIEINKTLI